MEYPKILMLRPDQPHKEKWDKYFRAMYLDECKRLDVVHTLPEEKMNQRVLDLVSPKGRPVVN